MKQIQQEIINVSRSDDLAKEEGILIGQMEERWKQEEILWRQKSKVDWLRQGERNTKFFHQEMIQRRQRNRIFSIKDEARTRVTQHEEIEQVLVKHFKELLTEPNVDRGEAIERICKEIWSRFTREKNQALMRAATLEEVEEVVKGMKKNKAPGPDGFTVEFYEAGWDFLGQDILDVVEESGRKQ